MLTADGKFVMQFTYSKYGYVHLRADTLDEAVKAYNEERVEHRMSTHKITAEHRAVVEEMQRRRKLFVAERRSKHRESTPPPCRRRPPRLSPAPAQGPRASPQAGKDATGPCDRPSDAKARS